jgi:hypothetical protein
MVFRVVVKYMITMSGREMSAIQQVCWSGTENMTGSTGFPPVNGAGVYMKPMG